MAQPDLELQVKALTEAVDTLRARVQRVGRRPRDP